MTNLSSERLKTKLTDETRYWTEIRRKTKFDICLMSTSYSLFVIVFSDLHPYLHSEVNTDSEDGQILLGQDHQLEPGWDEEALTRMYLSLGYPPTPLHYKECTGLLQGREGFGKAGTNLEIVH